MAKNSSSSRQRRQNRNRAQREALKARTAGQVPKRPSRIAPATADRLAKAPKPAERAGADDGDAAEETGTATRRNRKGKDRPVRERPPKLGDRPVDIETLEGGFLRKVSHVPGGLQVIMSVALAVMVAILTSRQKMFPEPGDESERPDLTRTLFEEVGTARGWAFLLIPVAAALVALSLSLHRQRRRIWLGAAFVVFAVIALNVVLLNYLFVGGFLLYAMWRAQKVEGPLDPLISRSRSRDDDEDGDGDDEDGDEADGQPDDRD